MSPYLLLLLSYLVGSIATSFWVTRGVWGVDLREEGSGNLGATNTFRVLGWKAALPVFLIDVAKGWFPVWYFPQLQATGNEAFWPVAYGAAAVLGHVFSIWVRFRGGKGVATSTGVLLGLAPWALLVGAGVWFGVVTVTRIVSLASILAAAALPVALLLTPHSGGVQLEIFGFALGAFVIWAHRSNIGRLLAGTENRFGNRGGDVV